MSWPGPAVPKSKGCKIKLIENKAASASKTAPVIMLDLFDVFIVPLSAVENGCLGKFLIYACGNVLVKGHTKGGDFGENVCKNLLDLGVFLLKANRRE